jgi:hypothetical protein
MDHCNLKQKIRNRSYVVYIYCSMNTKLVLCLIKHHTMKAYGRVEVWIHELISATNRGGDRSGSDGGNRTTVVWPAASHYTAHVVLAPQVLTKPVIRFKTQAFKQKISQAIK